MNTISNGKIAVQAALGDRKWVGLSRCFLVPLVLGLFSPNPKFAFILGGIWAIVIVAMYFPREMPEGFGEGFAITAKIVGRMIVAAGVVAIGFGTGRTMVWLWGLAQKISSP
jgi:hypothetical protein